MWRHVLVGSLVIDGSMSIGRLFSFVLYSVWVAVALGMMTALFNDYMKAVGATARVFELLDREPEIEKSDGQQLTDVRGLLEFREVSFAYPMRADVPILHSISLSIRPGQVTAPHNTIWHGGCTLPRERENHVGVLRGSCV